MKTYAAVYKSLAGLPEHVKTRSVSLRVQTFAGNDSVPFFLVCFNAVSVEELPQYVRRNAVVVYVWDAWLPVKNRHMYKHKAKAYVGGHNVNEEMMFEKVCTFAHHAETVNQIQEVPDPTSFVYTSLIYDSRVCKWHVVKSPNVTWTQTELDFVMVGYAFLNDPDAEVTSFSSEAEAKQFYMETQRELCASTIKPN